MIYNVITLLIYAVLIAAIIQPNAQRLFAAIIFISITLSHELLLSSYDGLKYYGSAALLDLAIIIITSGINPIPKMVIRIHIICMVSILVNLIGWMLWFLYYPPLIYDISFILIYSWALITFIKRDETDVVDYTMGSWITCFRFNRHTWYSYFNKYGIKI